MKLNINKSFSINTNWHGSDYKLCEHSITRAGLYQGCRIACTDKAPFSPAGTLYFLLDYQVVVVNSECDLLLWTLHSLLSVYCTLDRHKLEYFMKFCHFIGLL